MPGPLSGVRVVDISAVVVGPTCTRVLADQGAEVIKVEPPTGDIMRDIGVGRSPGMPSRFVNLNRNKRDICLDLKTDEGRGVLRRMLGDADVLINNMRPSALERLGLTYKDLCAEFPNLIHCQVLAFGRGGPYYDRPAYDPIMQGLSGMAATFETSCGEPRYVHMTMCDHITGLIAAQCICAALYRREKSGRGESVEVPMFENAAAFVMTEHMGGEIFEPPIGGTGNPNILSADNRPAKTADGYIAFAGLNDAQMFGFFAEIGRPELKADARFSTTAARNRNAPALAEIRRAALLQRTTDQWLEVFGRIGIPAGRCNSLADVLRDPHLKAVGFFQEEHHPTEGRLKRHRPANIFGGDPEASQGSPAPVLGADTVAILEETGFSADEIRELLHRSVAVQADRTGPAL